MEYFSLSLTLSDVDTETELTSRPGRCDTGQPAALHNMEIFYKIILKYFQELPPNLSMFLRLQLGRRQNVFGN